jgi:4'-phosphopantetheinyl transferase
MPARARRGGAPPLRLAAGELHVWTVQVPAGGSARAATLRALSPAERAEARRMRVPEARARFAVTRGTLRALLGAYLGRAPTRIRFDLGPEGKPGVRTRPHEPPIHFSVSHSGALALLAFSADGPVGVDLERLRELRDPLGLAERFLARGERVSVRGARGAARSRAFLSLWTAKEAVLKARGDGLDGLGRVEVARRGSGRGATLVGIEDGAERWSIRPLAPAPGYVGALATRLRAGR